MPSWLIIYEVIPIVLAIIAIPNLISTLTHGRSKKVAFLALVACILLIIIQTGEIQALLLNSVLPLSILNKAWTLFNSLVMCIFIIWSSRTRGTSNGEQDSN
jgi:hypothetical protein